MGTPEFPDLGKHCSLQDCNQIDFLPFKCDCCFQVLCLEHRSYIKHNCPKGNKHDITVVVCPLCAKGVRLNPDENANITWEMHVNFECDPSNYEKATKKKKCPVLRCKEALTFSNTIKCRDCSMEHCLKHRFGPDHNCPRHKEQVQGIVSRSCRPNQLSFGSSTSNSLEWAKSIFYAASSFRRIMARETEKCQQCGAKFCTVADLVEHAKKVHERSGSQTGGKTMKKVMIDPCPKCSRGFLDPASLVEHIERDHGGTSKA